MPNDVTDHPPKLFNLNPATYRRCIPALPLGNWPKARFGARLWPLRSLFVVPGAARPGGQTGENDEGHSRRYSRKRTAGSATDGADRQAPLRRADTGRREPAGRHRRNRPCSRHPETCRNTSRGFRKESLAVSISEVRRHEVAISGNTTPRPTSASSRSVGCYLEMNFLRAFGPGWLISRWIEQARK